MKTYPSIPKPSTEQVSILDKQASNNYVFYKLDGSNLLFKLDSKARIIDFRSRTRSLPIDHPVWGEAYNYFVDNQLDLFKELIKSNGYKNLDVFVEFYGYNSFAGRHQEEPKKCSVIDLCINNRSSLVDIPTFINLLEDKKDKTGHLIMAPLVELKEFWYGYDEELIKLDIQAIPEGVIVKDKTNTTRYKVKTHCWKKKVKSSFSTQEAEELLNS